MRRGFLIAGLALALIAAGGLAVLEASWTPDRRYQDAIRDSSPVAWWRFNDLKGDVARDSSGSGHDARLVGQVGRGVEGPLSNRIDTGASFDGSSYVRADDRFDFTGRRPFSVEVWVNPRSPQPSPFTRLISNEGFGRHGQRQGWSLYFDDSENTVGFERRSPRRAESAVAHLRLPPGEFTYLVGIFSGSKVRLYADGREIADSKQAQPLGLPPTKQPLTIGRLWHPSTAFFVGVLDEVAIYDHALTANQVRTHWIAAR